MDISQRLRVVYGAKYGLTVPEWRVLATIGQYGEITAKRVGRHSALHKTKVSRAVAALQAKRWISRRKNEADRREELLSLTTLGLAAYNSIVPDMSRFEWRLSKNLGPEGFSSIMKSLDNLEAALQALPGRIKSKS